MKLVFELYAHKRSKKFQYFLQINDKFIYSFILFSLKEIFLSGLNTKRFDTVLKYKF